MLWSLFMSSSQQPCHREVKKLVQGCTANKWKVRIQTQASELMIYHSSNFLKLFSFCPASWIRCFMHFHTAMIQRNCLHITSFNLQCFFMAFNFQIWRIILSITCKPFLSLCVSELGDLNGFCFSIFLQKACLVFDN